MKTSTFTLLLLLFVYQSKSQAPCALPPTVISPVTYCQNAVGVALIATGTNLVWGNTTQGTVGGTSTLPNVTYIDGSYNNKQVNFTSTTANVTINTVDYFIPHIKQ